ncbi:hypothetical protein SAMN05421819_3826 [Bryocella elongata]|uniref:SMP-30/Gluconolaconase/LRE-like region-containing protein n=1 Tax=Bryocella elongata TaxID=863522 RepID=A0A1H6BMI8_9BACT|nr:hypothetical protein [Bryocella elongata]SEG61655.1 hypothetical protein SAMN05421819_3826 [Bryocella elongata]
MKPSLRLATLPLAGAALASLLSLVLTGCGLGSTQAVTSTVATVKMSGTAHGGPNPITNANVTLWETWTTGIAGTATGRTAATASTYGSAAFQIGSTTTDASGMWNIASFNCDNGEYIYVTITGGKTASNSPNSNSVLASPVGACTTLPSSVSVNVTELSTIAMAYSLGAFTSENPTYLGTGSQQIWIGAPAANNVAAGSCSGTGSTLACTASGLGQAFTTAMDIVSSVGYGSTPSGNANTTLTDPSGATPNTSSSVPRAFINTLGNILQSCVNTSGGTAGDSSACGKLFSDTASGSLTPTDTLQAAMNIAAYPTVNVGPIYALGAPVSAFGPALTAQPNDFSLAITYTGPNSSTSFDAPKFVAIRPTEDVVVLTTNTAGTTDTLIDLATTGAVTTSVAQTATPGERQLAVDLSGNVFANQPLTSGAVTEYDALTFAASHSYPVNTPGGMAVDRNNTVYFTQDSSSAASIYYLTSGSFVPAQITLSSSPAPSVATSSSVPGALNFDTNQNLWMNMLGSSNQQVNYVYEKYVSPNTCTPPDFCGLNGANLGLTVGDSYSTVFDASGFAYSNAGARILQFDQNENNVGFYTPASGHTLKYASVDGDGVIFYPDATGGALIPFDTKSDGFSSLKPCSLRITNSTSQTTSCANALGSPASTQVDAAGAVWIADPGASVVVKLLGVASPAWPALALAKASTEPQ